MVERRSPKPNVEGSSPSWPVYFTFRDCHGKVHPFFQGVCRRVEEGGVAFSFRRTFLCKGCVDFHNNHCCDSRSSGFGLCDRNESCVLMGGADGKQLVYSAYLYGVRGED